MISTSSSGPEKPSVELLDFLISLAWALQKHSMYPAGHPSLRPAAQDVARRLKQLVGDQDALRVKVTPDRLYVGDAATAAGHQLLGTLAKRLHRHQILSVSLLADLGEGEVTEFLAVVGTEPGRAGTPLGASSLNELERWPHILIEPVPYERLALGESEGDAPESVDAADSARFWARVGSPLAGTDLDFAEWDDSDLAEDGDTSPAGQRKSAYDRLIESGLPKILEAWDGSADGATAVREGVSRLILSLNPDRLVQLLQLARSGDESSTDGEAQDVTEEAVKQLIDAARDMSNQRVPIWLVRLLTKIGMYAETASQSPGSEADGALGQLVQQLAVGWDVGDAKPADYEETLGRLMKETPALDSGRNFLEEPRSESIVQISLESDDVSKATRRAASAMLEDGELAALLGLLEGAPVGSQAAEELWGQLAQPENVRKLLEQKPPDFDSLDRLTPHVGVAAAEPMLEALMSSKSMRTRRELFDRLARFGAEVGPLAVNHLEDERWFVRRNMLALLDELPAWPKGFSPAQFLVDPEQRVRHEAVKLSLKVQALREMAILTALRAPDARTVSLGLSAVGKSCPTQALPHVIKHVLDSDHSPGLRVTAVRALAGTSSPAALRALLRLTWVRRWFLWGGIAPSSPLMLEALAVLAAKWPDDPRARRVLRRAARSKDPQVRSVMGSEGRAA